MRKKDIQNILLIYKTGVDDGERMWKKWKACRRDIFKFYCPVWCKLLVDKQFPSGMQMEDMLLKFRQAMWKKLVKDQASAAQMEKLKPFHVDYRPAEYEAFIQFGPPAGEAQSPIFKSEMSAGPSKALTNSGGSGGQNKKRPPMLLEGGEYIMLCYLNLLY